jgi:glycosyltransferase involved in cell wall biosynthesis
VRRKFLVISSNAVWGGSEELWSRTAAELARDGHDVTVMKGNVPEQEPRIRALRALNVRMIDLRRLSPIPSGLLRFLTNMAWQLSYAVQALHLARVLRKPQFDLAVLSMGGNLDGLFIGKRLRRSGIPYVIISQKAAEVYWPYDASFEDAQRLYRSAIRCLFVSHHNLRLTEQQLATDLPRAEVVRNPFLVPYRGENGWPDQSGGLALACVGRLFPGEKGQDILLRVLARDKWRARPVTLTLFGAGAHAKALQAMAAYLGLANVTFAGFTQDAEAIWRAHHALVLPSRCEGLPLVLVEAMLSARVAIVTDVAGAAEVVTDGQTGFLASAPTDDSFDDALERAWQRRDEWRTIGEAAAADIRMHVPEDPAKMLADRLLGWAGAGSEPSA